MRTHALLIDPGFSLGARSEALQRLTIGDLEALFSFSKVAVSTDTAGYGWRACGTALGKLLLVVVRRSIYSHCPDRRSRIS